MTITLPVVVLKAQHCTGGSLYSRAFLGSDQPAARAPGSREMDLPAGVKGRDEGGAPVSLKEMSSCFNSSSLSSP